MHRDAVVIIDGSGVIASGDESVFQRHNDYAEELSRASGEKLILVIAGSRKLLQYSSENMSNSLVIASSRLKRFHFFSTLFGLGRILDDLAVNPRLFVVGDPWKSGLIGVLMMRLKYRRVPFQLQIHADYAAPGWKSQTLRNFFKYELAQWIVSKYKFIRVVSKNQASNINFVPDQVVEVIPVSLSKRIGTSRQKFTLTELSFGFFGRLHKDRGTELLIDVFQRLLEQNPDVNLVIGGDGPERSRISNALVDRFPVQVTYLGEVSQKESDKFWNQVNVFISLAPFESYGRAIRESLLNACPVLALPSSGALDLAERVGDKWIALIRPSDSPDQILDKAQNLVKMGTRESVRESQVLCKNSGELLVQAWIKIIGDLSVLSQNRDN